MNPQELQGMSLKELSAHITEKHGMELRRAASALAGMKADDRRERFAAVVLFLAGTVTWTGKEAQAIKGE